MESNDMEIPEAKDPASALDQKSLTITRPSTDSLWSVADTPTSEQEEICCRVCHGEAEVTRPLFHPCRCDGSIKFVHQDCLQTWLKVSKQSRPKCELCGEQFHFRNIYASEGGSEGQPPSLSLLEFIQGVYTRTASSITIIAKTVLVFSLWSLILPMCTYWWVEITHMWIFGEDWEELLTWQHFPVKILKFIAFWWEGMCTSIIVLISTIALMQVYHFLLSEVRKFRGVLRLAALNAKLKQYEARLALLEAQAAASVIEEEQQLVEERQQNLLLKAMPMQPEIQPPPPPATDDAATSTATSMTVANQNDGELHHIPIDTTIYLHMTASSCTITNTHLKTTQTLC